jgi:thymidylate synthase
MFSTFEGPTADEVWQQIAHAFRTGKFPGAHNSRAGATKELLHATIAIEDPRQRWIASRQPSLNLAFALAEIIWIIRGRNDSAFLNYFNRELPKYAGNGLVYHGAYGFRLRSQFGFDQLERAYSALRHNPDTRQVALQIWDAKVDFPDSEGAAVAADIPCNMTALLKVREGRLEWLQVMRSNDLFRGLPYNIVQFTALQEILAGWLDLKLGGYHHVSDSLHVYDNTTGDIERSVPITTVANEDDLAVSKSVSEQCFAVLESLVERIIDPADAIDGLLTDFDKDMPKAFLNIAAVLCAEGARRRKNLKLVERAMEGCSNPIYVQLYDGWRNRTGTMR